MEHAEAVKKDTITVFLLDVGNDTLSVEQIVRDDLDAMHRFLDCDCIDIVVRKVHGTAFDVVCDDEGLFRDKPKISAMDSEGNPVLVGNLMFAHHDSHGNLTGLSEKDIGKLYRSVGLILDDHGLRSVITGLEY